MTFHWTVGNWPSQSSFPIVIRDSPGVRRQAKSFSVKPRRTSLLDDTLVTALLLVLDKGEALTL